jgi:hypothetical protein
MVGTVPSTNLCTVGTLSGSITGSGPWNWTCAGGSGGSSASCSASSNLVSGACTNLSANATFYNSTENYSLTNADIGTTLNAVTAGYSASPAANTCQWKCGS